jgi:hypothetical protein
VEIRLGIAGDATTAVAVNLDDLGCTFDLMP